ncbi:MAG: NADH-quinone oxidoreductase subunit H [Elusimicrobia bacterium]|nr:NADH-quinone oxidoreductase subunit H [Elusimicrobiota bacterium]
MSVLWVLAKVAGGLGFGMIWAAFLGWVERKQSAVMQDRIGANRADILGFKAIGLFHIIADPIKLFTKEDFVPQGVRKAFHAVAPSISLGFPLLALAAFPYGGTVEFLGRPWSLQPVESPMGLVLVLGMVAVGIHGVVMAGYASNSYYGLLGGLRGASQMIAYEACLAATMAGAVFLFGTLDLAEAVAWQARMIGGVLPAWGIVLQPLGFVLFLIAGAALTKRTPFDLPEGESEIVGYHVEYSGMKFGMFMMTDLIESVVVASLATTLFLGGWHVPFLTAPGVSGAGVALPPFMGSALPAGLHGPILAALMLGSFTAKVALVLFVLMQIRWTLPRFRFDQLLDLGWKNILPLALANFLVTAWAIYLAKAWGIHIWG